MHLLKQEYGQVILCPAHIILFGSYLIVEMSNEIFPVEEPSNVLNFILWISLSGFFKKKTLVSSIVYVKVPISKVFQSAPIVDMTVKNPVVGNLVDRETVSVLS